jgi:hypothetical protein
MSPALEGELTMIALAEEVGVPRNALTQRQLTAH